MDSNDCSGEMCTQCALVAGSTYACNENVVPLDRLTCYTCSGNSTSACGSVTAVPEHRIICPLFRNDDQCVATKSGDIITRGCLSSMQNANCETTHRCCLGHGCNSWEIDDIPNSAMGVHSALKVMLVALVGVLIGYNNL